MGLRKWSPSHAAPHARCGGRGHELGQAVPRGLGVALRESVVRGQARGASRASHIPVWARRQRPAPCTGLQGCGGPLWGQGDPAGKTVPGPRVAGGPFGGHRRASMWDVACEVVPEVEGTSAGSHARGPALPGPVLATWFVQGAASGGAAGRAERRVRAACRVGRHLPRDGRGGGARGTGSDRGGVACAA